MITAVVVTYNRLALLQENLAALDDQSRRPDRIVVVDNASTDGTGAWLDQQSAAGRLTVLRLERNLGGAGGFHHGLKASVAGGATWTWLMDDDTIPAAGCLQELLDGAAACADETPMVCASRVEWTDGSIHPMNVIALKYGYDRERFCRLSARGFPPIRAATFVSILVHRQAVAAHGLPVADYFLWCDDIEYTMRLLKDAVGIFCPRSLAVHKTVNRYGTLDAVPARFFYHVRNQLWMLRLSPGLRPNERLVIACMYLVSLGRYLLRRRGAPAAAWHIGRGLFQAVTRRPRGA